MKIGILVTTALITSILTFSVSAAQAETPIAALSIEQSARQTATKNIEAIGCISGTQAYRGLSLACDSIQLAATSTPSFTTTTTAYNFTSEAIADKIVVINPKAGIACFLPSNGSHNGAVSCGLLDMQ